MRTTFFGYLGAALIALILLYCLWLVLILQYPQPFVGRRSAPSPHRPGSSERLAGTFRRRCSRLHPRRPHRQTLDRASAIHTTGPVALPGKRRATGRWGRHLAATFWAPKERLSPSRWNRHEIGLRPAGHWQAIGRTLP